MRAFRSPARAPADSIPGHPEPQWKIKSEILRRNNASLVARVDFPFGRAKLRASFPRDSRQLRSKIVGIVSRLRNIKERVKFVVK